MPISIGIGAGFLLLIAIAVHFALRHAAARNESVIRVVQLPQNILKTCKTTTKFLGKGAEAEVYLGEFVLAGKVRQIASKIYHTTKTSQCVAGAYTRPLFSSTRDDYVAHASQRIVELITGGVDWNIPVDK
jgi:hypothetical protein